MAGIVIDTRQLTAGAKAFERLAKEFPGKVSDVLNKNADAIELAAKRAAPADRSQLRQNINVIDNNLLHKQIVSHAPYSAYVEFGTGKYAAQYVSTLPNEYQVFASKYKKGRGWPPLQAIKEWVIRKGIVGKGKKNQQKAEQVAYAIARSIFINGVHPHPFMVPAAINQQPKLAKDFIRLLKTLKIV